MYFLSVLFADIIGEGSPGSLNLSYDIQFFSRVITVTDPEQLQKIILDLLNETTEKLRKNTGKSYFPISHSLVKL